MFSFLPFVVYPVGMTTYWCNFVNNCKQLCECVLYSNHTWYQDAPLHHLSVYQISRQSDNPFSLYGNFNTFTKRKKKLSQFLEVHISEMPGKKFGMWGTDSGRHLHSKIVRFCTSSTKLCMPENCIIVLPVNILMGVARRLLGLHNTLPCFLMQMSCNGWHVVNRQQFSNASFLHEHSLSEESKVGPMLYITHQN